MTIAVNRMIIEWFDQKGSFSCNFGIVSHTSGIERPEKLLA
jgi:hypothetical protein